MNSAVEFDMAHSNRSNIQAMTRKAVPIKIITGKLSLIKVLRKTTVALEKLLLFYLQNVRESILI